jgi:hypothetical protein
VAIGIVLIAHSPTLARLHRITMFAGRTSADELASPFWVIVLSVFPMNLDVRAARSVGVHQGIGPPQ